MFRNGIDDLENKFIFEGDLMSGATEKVQTGISFCYQL